MKKLSFLLISIALIACSNSSNDESLDKELSPTSSEVETNIENSQSDEENSTLGQVDKNEQPQTGTPGTKSAKTSGNSKLVKEDNEMRVVTDENLPSPPAPEMPKIDFSKVYPAILSSYVSSSGKVNYASIKTNSEMLDQAINHYQENTPKSSWSSNQKLAYWINAYNLFTIKLIIDNYPTSSIKNIAGGKPWDKKFIQLDGKTMSLNDIENGIIRKQFNEPRIHFAVNCASISCPKLLNQEYTSSNLNSLLEKQAKRYINDKNENTFTSNSAKISNIFDWYKDDFDGGVIPFLNKYLSNPLPLDAKITYEDYNWNLNN